MGSEHQRQLDESGDEVLEELDLELKARELRNALEELLEEGGILEENWEQENLIVQFAVLLSKYPVEALQRAVLMTTSTSDHTDHQDDSYTGRLPIHLACDKNAPIQVIQQLLDSDPNKESILRKDKWGDLPIHTACSRKNYFEVVRLLLESDKQKKTIYGKDLQGSIPLHYACRYGATPDVIELLLEHDTERRTLFAEGIYNQIPLHICCRGGNATKEVVATLLKYDESNESVLKEDNVGRLPIHVAFLKNSDMDVIQLLLEAMICGRSERHGLQNWKRHIHAVMRSMSAHERDFMTRERLDSVIGGLRSLLERAHLLELVIWKMSCFIHAKCDHVKNLSKEIKAECRIKSDASLIIPHILAWIEAEPIESFVAEWKNIRPQAPL